LSGHTGDAADTIRQLVFVLNAADASNSNAIKTTSVKACGASIPNRFATGHRRL
jgi:hypothetical protein